MPKPPWERVKTNPLRALRVALASVGILILLAPSHGAKSEGDPPVAARTNQELSLAAAKALEAKFQLLSKPNPGPQASPDQVVITDVEANSYLKFRGREFLPPGVYDPQIQISPQGVSGSADVDFDELNKANASTDDLGARFLAAIFKGRQQVSGTGELETGKGEGKVKITNVKVGAMAIPDLLVDLLVQQYVQSRYKIDISKAFPLPPHVTHIEMAPGRAIFHRNPAKRSSGGL